MSRSRHSPILSMGRAHRVHQMPFGAELRNRQARFRLWAPAQPALGLVLEGHAPHPMQPTADGWYESVVNAQAGAHYQFALSDGTLVPDPASRYQPRDVEGPSELIDSRAYRWSSRGWRGRPWDDAVLYELHVGTFSEAGTFAGVIDKLDHLVALGITAIQLMPIADFAGRRNWGYDGVLPYACASSYGRPDDLKRLVDEAHARGLMVLLDVVYNHFGPEGNYLSTYAPQFFTERHQTPWGDGINFDGPHSRPVRDFFIDSAIRWINEFHIDGLRLDAVHAILDDSETHFIKELADRVRAAVAAPRRVHLILENEENESSRLLRDSSQQPLAYTAQWNDDVHHVLHTAATGEACGYYEDYVGDTEKLARALAEGFAFQGEVMPFRGSPRGEPCASLPPEAFVSFIQNHDQIGNRARGERLPQLARPEALRAVAAIYLLCPATPLLFMGEEWGSVRPFTYFCDLPQLAAAIREGRRKEFARFPEFESLSACEAIPDPNDPATFEMARLQWSELNETRHSQCLEWYRAVLALRRQTLRPLFRSGSTGASFTLLGSDGLRVCWRFAHDVEFCMVANLASERLSEVPRPAGDIVFAQGTKEDDRTGTLQLDAWAVGWFLTAS